MNPSAIPFTSRLTSSHPPPPRLFDTRRPSLEDTSHMDEWRSPHIRTSHSSSPHRHATPPMPHLSPSSSEKIHALLAVINDLDNLGVEHKFIDSLHIAYRQMFPQLQITGRSLFDIASQAEQLGLITITGDEPHRQIQLTAKGAHLYHSKNMRPNSSSYSRRGSNASTSSYVTTPTEPDLFPNLHESSLESLLQSADAQLEGMERYPTYDDIPIPVVSNQDYVEHQRRQSQIATTSTVPPISVGGFTNPNNTGVASPLTTSSMVGTNGLPLFNPAPGVFFDAGSLEDKLFRGEKPRHLKYMFGFRVNPCHDFLNNKCPAESKTRSSTQCFDYHAPKTKRRVARIYQYSNGIFFNYNACRCQAMEKDEKCDRGDACRYAHCKEEIAYHPSRYKTQQCSYPARSDGVCTRFGAHCAFAHGEDDMRKPLILKQGMPHKLIDGSDGAPVALQARTAPTGLESDDGPTDRPLRLDDFICSPEEMPAERHFYMYVYKTKPCSEPTMDCARGICPNYHYANKRRRNPKLYAYTYEPCPNVKSPDSGQWRQPSACEKGDACPYAHTLLESMYHPDVYKTVLCSNFDEHDPSNWKCQWGRHCAHAHSQAELEYNENHNNDEVARTPTTEILGGKRGSVARTSFSGFLPAAASASTPTRPSPVNVASSPSHATMLSTHLRAGSPSITQSLTISMPNTPVNQPRSSPVPHFPRSPIGQGTRALGLGLPSTTTTTSGSISPSPSPSLPTGALFPSHAPSLGPDLLRIDTPTERATPSEMRRSSVPTPSDGVLRPRGFTYASQSTPSSPHLTPRTWNKPPHPLSITRGREDDEEKNKESAMEQENIMLKRKIATMTEELEQHQRHQHQSSLEISSLQQRLAEMDRHLQGDMSIHELIQSLRTQLAHVQEQHQGVQWECMQLRDAKQKQDITHAEVMRTLAKQQEEKNAMEIHYTGLQEEMSRMKMELANITAQRDEAMNKLAETPSSHSRTSSLMSQQMWDRSVITLTPEEWDTIQQRIYKMSSLILQHDFDILHDIMKQAHTRLFNPSFPSFTDVSLSQFIIESIIHMDEITNDVTLHARIKGGNEEVVLHVKCPAQEGGFSIPAFHTSIPPHPHLLPIFTHFSDNIDDDKLGLATLNTSTSPHLMHALQSLVNHHSNADIMVTAPYITSLSHVTHRWNIREITYLAIQLCSAVCHMHQYQVVHGAITADEIMVMTRIAPETTPSPSYPSINMATSTVSSPSLSSRTISMPNSITSSPIVSPRYLDFAKMVTRRPSLHPMITVDRIMDGIQQDIRILLSLTHAYCIDVTKGWIATTTSTTSTLIAPEWVRAIRDHRDQMDYSGVDAWAVGMLLYQLVTGTSHPFRVDDITACTDADYISPSEVSSAVTATSPSQTSMEITLHRIIASLLRVDPTQRLTLSQARTQLEHEYWSHHHTHVQQRTSNASETIPALSLDIAMRVMDADVKEKNVNVNIDRLRVEDGLLLDTLVSQRLTQVDDA